MNNEETKHSKKINGEKEEKTSSLEKNQKANNGRQDEVLTEEEDSNSTNLEAEIESLKKQLEEKAEKSEEYYNMLQRAAAEFDNFKKRTLKEKQFICCDTTSEVVAAFLPVMDNLERALKEAEKEESGPLKEGVDMVYKQMMGVLKSLDVEEIASIGKKFNPEYHNAVMHIEDEQYGENEIIEEFQKGYTLGDKVIRHSMVKVAN